MHDPSLQTWSVAQFIPFMALPVPTQSDVPVAHDVEPSLQILLFGLHVVFSTQVTQLPFKHTRFIPHGLPLLTVDPVSVQLGDPEHDCVPP